MVHKTQHLQQKISVLVAILHKSGSTESHVNFQTDVKFPNW